MVSSHESVPSLQVRVRHAIPEPQSRAVPVQNELMHVSATVQ